MVEDILRELVVIESFKVSKYFVTYDGFCEIGRICE